MLLNLYADIGRVSWAETHRLQVLIDRAHVSGETIELHLCVDLLILEIDENILDVLHLHLPIEYFNLVMMSIPR